MKVQLLYFSGCPHVDATRQILRHALRACDQPPEFDEVDVTAADAPAALCGWGSPTILVDGVDIGGGQPSGTSCRLYPGSDRPGAPAREFVENRIRDAIQRRDLAGNLEKPARNNQ